MDKLWKPVLPKCVLLSDCNSKLCFAIMRWDLNLKYGKITIVHILFCQSDMLYMIDNKAVLSPQCWYEGLWRNVMIPYYELNLNPWWRFNYESETTLQPAGNWHWKLGTVTISVVLLKRIFGIRPPVISLGGGADMFYRVGQTQLGSFSSFITNQSNNTRENGKVPFVGESTFCCR
jgi:hypothetical protein